MSIEKKASKAPVMFIEVADQRSSGFIKDGTENTPFREELKAPSVLWINANSFACEMKEGVRHNVKIRFIKNCDILDPIEQEKRGFKPNKNADKIQIEKGFASIVREGSTVGLYDYLEKSYYNQDNPNRPATATARYKMQRLDKDAQGFNENDIKMADAIKLVASLQTNTGTKDNPSYKYNEERIDAICSIVAVHADTYPQKVYVLMSLAKAKPDFFLENVVKYEETIHTEIAQAIQLEVIRFEGNVAQYSDGSKVLKSLGAGNMSNETKVEKLADYLKTKDASADLTELRAKIEVAKSKV